MGCTYYYLFISRNEEESFAFIINFLYRKRVERTVGNFNECFRHANKIHSDINED